MMMSAALLALALFVVSCGGRRSSPPPGDVVDEVDLVDPTGQSHTDGIMRISDDKWIYTLDIDDTGLEGLADGCYAAEFTITLPGGCMVYAYAAFRLK